MTRYFVRNRGRAIAIASLGGTAGKAVLPFLALVSITAIGWRWTYGWFGIIIAITSIPAVLRLLRGWGQLHSAHLKRFDVKDSKDNGASSWSRQQVLRDPRFYLMLPGLVAPGFIGTALFFHHLNIADAKGWEASWITANYVIYAVAIVFSMLASGALVDRLSARSVVQFMLIPLVAALIIIGFADHHLWFIPYMIILAIHWSMASNSTSAIWPELYGVGHLGAIKSMYFALAVVSSAFGPVIFGILIDHELSIRNICLLAATYATLCNVVLVLTLRTGKKRTDKIAG
jgi:predicted MFS family arabinose efflux permease